MACFIKDLSFNVWVRYFVWNFKGTLWNSTQNILPIHWNIWLLYNIEMLRALRFKSSYALLKRPPPLIKLHMTIEKLIKCACFSCGTHKDDVDFIDLWPVHGINGSIKTTSVFPRQGELTRQRALGMIRVAGRWATAAVWRQTTTELAVARRGFAHFGSRHGRQAGRPCHDHIGVLESGQGPILI